MRRIDLGRWRHLAILLPMGVGVGTLFGVLWNDTLFGTAVGASFGAAFGLLLAVRNVR